MPAPERTPNIDLSNITQPKQRERGWSLKMPETQAQGRDLKPLQHHQIEATNPLLPDFNALNYWDVTKECLETIHGKTPQEVDKIFTDYKARVAQLPADRRDAVIAIGYHVEAFYTANDLAKNEIPFSEHRDEYNKMWQKRLEPTHSE